MCKHDAWAPLFKEVSRLKVLVMKQIKGQKHIAVIDAKGLFLDR